MEAKILLLAVNMIIKNKLGDRTIDGILLFSLSANEEQRGNIWTTYTDEFFRKNDATKEVQFIHDKFSVSNYNVFRGFHGDFNTTKLVTCVYGEITQFVLDWRPNSPTFGQLNIFNICRQNMISVLVPPGCGNAYYVKSEQAVYHYKLAYTGSYRDANDQFTVSWRDPRIVGFPSDGFNPITSERDK